MPDGIAVDASNVYWTSADGVMKAPRGGGAAVTLVASDEYSGPLAVDETSVYAMGAGLVKIPIEGGAVMTLAPLPQDPDDEDGAEGIDLALSRTTVYWTQTAVGGGGTQSGVLSVPVNGGPTTRLASSDAYGITVYASRLYWATDTSVRMLDPLP